MGCKSSKPEPVAPAPRRASQAKCPSTGVTEAHIQRTDNPVNRDYLLGDLLGKGSFGHVYLGSHKKTGKIVAIKIMDRSKVKPLSIEREYKVLEHIGTHPNVVEYHGTYSSAKDVSFVFEIMKGGELFERLIKYGAYSEAIARKSFRQVAEALAYLHRRGIVHRDLKPENLLLATRDSKSDVKVADFGLSHIIKPGEKLTKICGTWAYAAPEMSDSSVPGYDTTFDTWSYGVILFIVLCGYHPFDPHGMEGVPKIKENARNAVYDFDQGGWDAISKPAIQLIKQLIVKNPKKRLSAAQILEHPWFKAELSEKPISTTIDKDLDNYRKVMARKLRVSMYSVLAMSSIRSMRSAVKEGEGAPDTSRTRRTTDLSDTDANAKEVGDKEMAVMSFTESAAEPRDIASGSPASKPPPAGGGGGSAGPPKST